MLDEITKDLSRSKRMIRLIISGILAISITAIDLFLLLLVGKCALHFLLDTHEGLHHIWLKTVI